MKFNIKITQLHWDIYEVTTQNTLIHGIKLRGKLRKYSISKKRALLTENATDKANTVRFAIPHGEKSLEFVKFIHSLLDDATIILVMQNVLNPVLSKLKVNDSSRYEI